MNANAQDNIDLKAIFRKLAAKWWLFLITTSVFLGLAVAYLKTTPKRYAVTGIMLMSDKKRNNFGSMEQEFLKGTSYLSNNGELEDQISVLMSYANVRRAIDRLDFGVTYFVEKNFKRQESYGVKPFVVRTDSSLQAIDILVEVIPDRAAGTYRVKAEGKNVSLYNPRLGRNVDDFVPKFELDQVGQMGKPFQSDFLSFSIDFPEGRDYPRNMRYYFAVHSPDGVTAQWRGSTITSPQSDESNIISITTSGEVVQKQQDFINMLMDTYIQWEQDRHNEKGKKTIAFIDAQLDRSSQDLSQAETNLQNAQTTGGSLVGSAADRSSAVYSDLSRLQDERGRIQSTLQSLTEMIARMNGDDDGSVTTISAANVNAPALSNLIEGYNRDVAELAQRRLTERQQSAPTLALNRKVQTSKSQITQMASDIRRSTQLELDQVNGRIGQLNYQLSQLPKDSRQVAIASRKYEVNSEMNTYLMEKRYEAEIAVESDQVDKFVVDEARMAGLGPVAPDKKVALGGALFLGLLLPILFIIVRDFFNDKIMDLDELKRLTQIPVLATIPTSKQRRIDLSDSRSLLTESFRTARINLQYLNADVDRQVVGFTSSTSGEGKTFCAINLATVMAVSGKRTLLIDGDMRRPRVHEYMDLSNETGLSSYLVGGTGLDQVVRKSDVPGLDVIVAGPIPPNPLELMESPRLAELFQQMRSRYDQIVVDASPMGLVSEFKVMMRYIDVSLYVVRQGYTRRPMLRQVNELHREGKLQRMDVLLNDVKAGDGYGYYYGPK